MNEAARMVEEGVAEDIDTAVRLGFGLRFSVLGLLEFIDWGGGDILYYASRYLASWLACGAGRDRAQHGTGPQRLARRPGLLTTPAWTWTRIGCSGWSSATGWRCWACCRAAARR